MKYKFIRLLGLVAAIGLLNSCSLFGSSKPIYLDVSTYSNENMCSEGLQATLTVLEDSATLTSVRLKEKDTHWAEATPRAYDANGQRTKVKLEAYCYEVNETSGHIILEGTLSGVSFKDRSSRLYQTVDVYLSKEEYCLTEHLAEEHRIRIISIKEPFPCVQSYDFSLKDF